MLGLVLPVVEFGSVIRTNTLDCMCQQSQRLRRYLTYMCACVYLCTLFEITEYASTIGKNLQQFYCCNIKYALTSSVVLEIFLFRLMQSFSFQLTVCSVPLFLFSFLTSPSTKELKLQCPSLNKHYRKKNLISKE